MVNAATLAGRSPPSNPLRLHIPDGGGARCGAVRSGVEVDVGYLADPEWCGKCLLLTKREGTVEWGTLDR